MQDFRVDATGSEAATESRERTAAPGGPVTMSIARQIAPGREADYEAWLRGITADALTFGGHMGVNVIRPAASSGEYVTIFRFDSYDHLRAWEDSPQRLRWLQRLEGMVQGEDAVQREEGLEFWFSLPGRATQHPSPHKMVVVLLVVVFCLVSLLNFLLAPLTEAFPRPLQVLLVVFLQVSLMTYLVMPRITRLLQGWLYR